MELAVLATTSKPLVSLSIRCTNPGLLSEFKGSFSIKKVLPAVCPDNPELDYEALAISNGGMAMNAFKEMRDNSIKRNNNSIRAELFEYCRLDTYAMYAIFNKLLLIADS